MYGGATFIRLSSIYASDISRMFLFHERDLCTGSIGLEIKTWKRSGSAGYYEHKELKKSCIAIYGYYTRYLWSVKRNGKFFFILIFTGNLLACVRPIVISIKLYYSTILPLVLFIFSIELISFSIWCWPSNAELKWVNDTIHSLSSNFKIY